MTALSKIDFFKLVPNFVQCWSGQKRELLAMICVLGKTTVFITLGTNEIRWPKFLNELKTLNIRFNNLNNELIHWSQRCMRLRENPVTCFIYIKKLVDWTRCNVGANWKSCSAATALDFVTRIKFQLRQFQSTRNRLSYTKMQVSVTKQNLDLWWLGAHFWSEHQCVLRVNNLTSSTTSAAGGLAIYTTKSPSNRMDINISDQSIHTRKFGYICRTEFPIATDEISFTCVLESI